jgi:hypothetical protein
MMSPFPLENPPPLTSNMEDAQRRELLLKRCS